MATIAEQLTSLANTKAAIKDAIVAKGVAVADTDPFSAYPAKIGQISGGSEETRFGAKTSNLLGAVDADGNYMLPTEPFMLDLSGVKFIPEYAFYYRFYNMYINGVVAPDLITAGGHSFNQAFAESVVSADVVFGMETITNSDVFYKAFSYATWTNNAKPRFVNLRMVNGDSIFESVFESAKGFFAEWDEVFPVLEEIQGNVCFYLITRLIPQVRATKLKKIIGGGYSYYSTFGSSTTFYFPNVNEVSGYVCAPGVLHFAAANQADIEACDGYSYMFGATEIHFDLMLNITVNGVMYSREHTIGGYTSWKDASDNIVYTDATAEPAVGTAVYSDAGTTQVGTVEGVA